MVISFTLSRKPGAASPLHTTTTHHSLTLANQDSQPLPSPPQCVASDDLVVFASSVFHDTLLATKARQPPRYDLGKLRATTLRLDHEGRPPRPPQTGTYDWCLCDPTLNFKPFCDWCGCD
ncbi:uncharacterized protein LOC114181213 isoform X2 [Vigna unguiculata]|uniref:uncharacterized protein LOC114181213 isoform X2 n=1 Tax=Vigna unguiculata TaxID=3917 RepID=UPI001016D9E1|nr:uncharacterized protein LOC114181213 isoform X2 [Vigna unguiculata]